MKKPVLLTFTITLGLPAKHSDAFHCLHKHFQWIWGLERASWWSRTNPSSPWTDWKLAFIWQIMCLIFKCLMNATFTLNLVKKETLQQWQSISGSGSATHVSAHTYVTLWFFCIAKNLQNSIWTWNKSSV